MRAAVVVAAVVAAGCAPSAFVLRGASQTRADDLARCAARRLERLGYTITEGAAERGMISAAKNSATTMTVLRSGIDSEDRLVVTAGPGGPDGGGVLRVAAQSLFWRADGGKMAETPSATVTADANRILEGCGILDGVRVGAP
jgi:hypothetical protein